MKKKKVAKKHKLMGFSYTSRPMLNPDRSCITPNASLKKLLLNDVFTFQSSSGSVKPDPKNGMFWLPRCDMINFDQAVAEYRETYSNIVHNVVLSN